MVMTGRSFSSRCVTTRWAAPAAPAAVAHGVHVHGVDLCGIVWPGHQEAVIVIVPRHRQNAVGTPRSFIRQTGFTAEELRRVCD